MESLKHLIAFVSVWAWFCQYASRLLSTSRRPTFLLSDQVVIHRIADVFMPHPEKCLPEVLFRAFSDTINQRPKRPLSSSLGTDCSRPARICASHFGRETVSRPEGVRHVGRSAPFSSFFVSWTGDVARPHSPMAELCCSNMPRWLLISTRLWRAG